MSKGKQAATGRQRSLSESDSESDSDEEIHWEPEVGGVFHVPLTEFYSVLTEAPVRFHASTDWKKEVLVGKFKDKKRSNRKGKPWTYGIDFDDGNPTAYYHTIYDWKEYYLGPDLNDNGEDSGVGNGSDSDMDVDPPSGGAGSANIEVVQDPDEVILERDEDESDLDEDDDPLGNEAPEQDENTPMDTRLAAMKWEDAGVVNEDTRKPRHDPDNFEPAVRLENRGVTTFIDWFFVWFPKSLLMKITVATNQAARKRKWPASGKWKSLTHGELLRWLGMWMLMGVYRTSPRRMYWRGILGFGKWMSEKRFEQIMSAFSLPTYRRNDGKWGGPAKGKIKFDRMHLVRCFLDLLAVAWQKAIAPGGRFVLDESMVAWLGIVLKMPGWKVIKRKPHPFGLEFKTVCCSVTGIMVNFEAQEGKDIMQYGKFVKEVNKSSAWCLRLSEPWHHTHRTLIADAALGQVRAVVALREHGLYMICNVKMCHKFFPKAELKEKTPPLPLQCQLHHPHPQGQGEEVKMKDGKEMEFLACGWRATNNMVVTYLASCSLTVPGVPTGRRRGTSCWHLGLSRPRGALWQGPWWAVSTRATWGK